MNKIFFLLMAITSVAYSSETVEKYTAHCQGGGCNGTPPNGPMGDPGPVGARGSTGATGVTGPTGPSGVIGPIGTSGPTAIWPAFGQAIGFSAADVAPLDSLPLSAPFVVNGMTYNGLDGLAVGVTGTYLISFSAFPTVTPSQEVVVGVTVNNTANANSYVKVAGGASGLTGTMPLRGTIMSQLNTGDVVRLQNASTTTPLTFDLVFPAFGGGSAIGMSAELTLILVTEGS